MKTLKTKRSDLDKVPEDWLTNPSYDKKGIRDDLIWELKETWPKEWARDLLALRSYHNRLADTYYVVDTYSVFADDIEWDFIHDETHPLINFFHLLRESPWWRKKGFGIDNLRDYFTRSNFCYIYRFRRNILYLIPKYYGDKLLETGDRTALESLMSEGDVDKYFSIWD